MEFDVDHPAWAAMTDAIKKISKEDRDDDLRRGIAHTHTDADADTDTHADTGRNDAGSDKGGGAPPCEHCGTGVLKMHEGNFVCVSCCSVGGRQLDYGAEWRFYGTDSSQANPTRCCPPTNSLLQSAGSVIAGSARRRASQWAKRSEATADASSAASHAGRTVQRYQAWSSMSYRDRVLCGVFDTLSSSAAHHGLPACILEEAKVLYKRVSDARITRGENRSAVIAVSVYLACKSCGVPRSLKEVAEMFDMSTRALTKATHTFQQVDAGTDSGTSTPADFVRRFCSRLGMRPDAVELTLRVVERADELAVVCDAMPTSIVGGAILLVGNELSLGLTKADIASVCLVAPTTVAKTHKRLLAFRSQLLLQPSKPCPSTPSA
jgi:transcription initiation factor TFIIB